MRFVILYIQRKFTAGSMMFAVNESLKELIRYFHLHLSRKTSFSTCYPYDAQPYLFTYNTQHDFLVERQKHSTYINSSIDNQVTKN